MKHKAIYMNLEVAMLQNNMSIQDIAKASGLTYISVLRKLRRDSPWLLEECMAVKKALNSDLPIETLFERKE